MAYVCPLEIGFFAGGSISFSGETPTKRDLGGAEYCAVSMAEALASRGHRVSVFTKDSQEVYQGETHLYVNGVFYYPMERAWKEVCHATQWDVFIISRDFGILSNTVLTSKLTVLWNHDILSDPETFREHIHRADKIYCLSAYHKQQYLTKLTDETTGKCTLKPEHISLTRNGVDLHLIEEALKLNVLHSNIKNGKFVNPTFVYSSRPERGLFYLLRDIWPHVLERIPNAKLKVATYDVSAELLPEYIKTIHQACYNLMRRMPSVEFMGSLRRLELFQVIAASYALIYPSIFPEISCLSVLESQSLGTPALTSERGALKESNWTDENIIFNSQLIEDGFYGKELTFMTNPPQKEHVANWICDFYYNYWEKDEVSDRAHIQQDIQEFYDWNVIAGEWEKDFFTHFEHRSTSKAKRVIQNLIYHSDLLAAKWALEQVQACTGRIVLEESDFTTLDSEIREHLQYHHVEPEQYAAGELNENIHIAPERMKIVLDVIEKKFGHEQPFTLIDIGCGNGRMLYHILKNFHNCQVMGIDFSQKLCTLASENLFHAFPSLEGARPFIQQGDILEFPLPDKEDQADVVIAAEWLEHQVELVKALTTVDAWCKEGGLVIYTTPYGPWEAMSFGSAHTADGHEIRDHVSHFEHRDIAEMFQDVNYQVEACTIQRSNIDNSIVGNYVISYEKHTLHEDQTLASTDGYVTVQNKFYTPDYMRKFTTTRPYVRVGGLMITKDEEDNITRALKPVKRRVDHMLVYDTGSSDNTVKLACEHVDEVIEGYWDDDFGAARNRALDILLTRDVDVVLWFDADEVLLNAHRLKHYLQGDLGIYKSFIILQQHLMADMPSSSDIPIRLFKNKPEYKFLGKIHEHIMDVTDPNGNLNLFPLYIIPDAKFVHYGYVTEDERRWKAIYRNWDLIKKDREAYPNREMGIIFVMRDYINHVRWHLEKGLQLSQEDVQLLYKVIHDYDRFKEPTAQNHFYARVFYHNALEMLGKSGYPGPDGRVPIHAAMILAAKHGPLPQETFTPEMRWFKDGEELKDYMTRQIEKSYEFVEKKPRVFED